MRKQKIKALPILRAQHQHTHGIGTPQSCTRPLPRRSACCHYHLMHALKTGLPCLSCSWMLHAGESVSWSQLARLSKGATKQPPGTPHSPTHVSTITDNTSKLMSPTQKQPQQLPGPATPISCQVLEADGYMHSTLVHVPARNICQHAPLAHLPQDP
jgi:hypothetical protein